MAKRRRESVADLRPDRLSIPTVRAAAQGCRACDLWNRGTQTVFGEGPKKAALMLVGELPGDQEDLGPRCIPRLCCAPPDDETRQRETQRFIQDLRAIAKRL